MALSDCGKCWETPCVCGYQWPQWLSRLDIKHLEQLIAMAQERIRIYKKAKGIE